jgi:exocyst complex protein 7
MEALTRRATMLRDSLQRSQGNTDGMVAILGSFDHRLSALEAAMRPTQVRSPLSPSPSFPFDFHKNRFRNRAPFFCAGWKFIQVRTHAIRMAHENIDKTLKSGEAILSQFDLARKVHQLA